MGWYGLNYYNRGKLDKIILEGDTVLKTINGEMVSVEKWSFLSAIYPFVRASHRFLSN